MSDELSPEAQELIARIAARQRPEPLPVLAPPPIETDPVPLALDCDRCGLLWTDASGGQRAGSRSTLVDNAKAADWQERSRYGSRRHYCPSCSAAIAEREAIRTKGKRRR